MSAYRTRRFLLALALLIVGLATVLWMWDRNPGGPGTGTSGSLDQQVPALGEAEHGPLDAPLAGGAELALEPPRERAPAAETRVLEVVLLDLAGRPIAGERVYMATGKDRWRAQTVGDGRTDENGVARYPGLTPQTVDWAHARFEGMQDEGGSNSSWWLPHQPVGAWRTELNALWGMPLEVRVFDALTGRPMPDVPWGTGWLKVGTERRLVGRTARAKPGETATFAFHLDAPEGHVAWDPKILHQPIATSARGLLVHYPLHRAVACEVALRTPEGEPFNGQARFRLWCAGRDSVLLRSLSTGPGRYRLHGIPHLPGEPFTLAAGGDVGWAEWEGRLPLDLDASLEADLTLDPDAGVNVADKDAWPNSEPAPDLQKPDPIERAESERGALRVLCLLTDGTPARNFRVWASTPKLERPNGGAFADPDDYVAGTTDADGRVAWPDLPVGTWTVHFTGRLWTKMEADVAASQTTDLTLREPQGGSLRIEVVDRDNHPVPYATIEAEPLVAPWIQLPPGLLDADHVQRLDSYVDHLGRRTLLRLPTPVGGYEVRVLLGTRTGKGLATLTEGGSARLVVVLAPAP